MNKAREQIIEIIEDYMDKTLSEGCLIKTHTMCSMGNGASDPYYGIVRVDTSGKYGTETTETLKLFKSPGSYRYNYPLATAIKNSMYNIGCGFTGTIILGHYDITAVEKCIYENRTLLEIKAPGIYFKKGRKCVDYFVLGEGYKIYVFPEGPLNLYTEQEDKDLLELLKKLGKQ